MSHTTRITNMLYAINIRTMKCHGSVVQGSLTRLSCDPDSEAQFSLREQGCQSGDWGVERCYSPCLVAIAVLFSFQFSGREEFTIKLF